MDDKNFVLQLKLAIGARLYNGWDFLRTFFKYWRNFSFAKIDAALLSSYFWESPYRIARRESDEPYGETPLVTMEKIAERAKINKEDVVYELGAGRGRTCFWLACFRGCKVVGIEYNEVFVEKAKRVKYPRVAFINQDYLLVDMTPATVIYLYGTLLEEKEIFELCKRWRGLKKGTRIVTISYPLQEYVAEPLFRLIEEFEVEFQWGRTSAYLQEKL